MRHRASTLDVGNIACSVGMRRAWGVESIVHLDTLPGPPAWTQAWSALRQEARYFGDIEVAAIEGRKWTDSVQHLYRDELEQFMKLTDDELDASLALMRDVKPWAFWIAACACMVRAQMKINEAGET